MGRVDVDAGAVVAEAEAEAGEAEDARVPSAPARLLVVVSSHASNSPSIQVTSPSTKFDAFNKSREHLSRAVEID